MSAGGEEGALEWNLKMLMTEADWIRARSLWIQHLSSWQGLRWPCCVRPPTGSFTGCFSKPLHPQIPSLVLYITPDTSNAQNKKFRSFFVYLNHLFIYLANKHFNKGSPCSNLRHLSNAPRFKGLRGQEGGKRIKRNTGKLSVTMLGTDSFHV